nr:MAG TPA: hypothetical protein [Caudoviricetes sp.]
MTESLHAALQSNNIGYLVIALIPDLSPLDTVRLCGVCQYEARKATCPHSLY